MRDEFIEIGTKPIPTAMSKTFNSDDYKMPISEKFIAGLQEYFKLSREEVIRKGEVSDYLIFDSLFTPEVLERNDPKEINQIYASTPYFAFRNPIYYAGREESAFAPFIEKITNKKGSVLDHGCGAGVFAEVLLRKGIMNITLTDIPGPMMNFVKWFFGDKVKYEDNPDNIQGHYDYITSNSVLEHLPNPISTVEMFGEHLNPGGLIIASMATDIHGQHLKKAIDKYKDVMLAIEEINRKSESYYNLQITGSAWTTQNPHYQEMLKQGIDWLLKDMTDKPGSILDLGCGDAWGTEYLRKQLPAKDIRIVGGDIDVNKLEAAKERKVVVEYQDMHNVTGKWDTIFCFHTLEHSYDAKKALNSILNALSVNGKLYLIVPIEEKDPRSYNPSHTQWFGNTDLIKNEVLNNKEVEIVSEETKTRDTLEYWLIVRRKI